MLGFVSEDRSSQKYRDWMLSVPRMSNVGRRQLFTIYDPLPRTIRRASQVVLKKLETGSGGGVALTPDSGRSPSLFNIWSFATKKVIQKWGGTGSHGPAPHIVCTRWPKERKPSYIAPQCTEAEDDGSACHRPERSTGWPSLGAASEFRRSRPHPDRNAFAACSTLASKVATGEPMASTSDASPAPPASPVPSTWISGCNRAPSPVAPAEATAAAGGEAAPERGGVNGVVAAGASASVWDPAASVGRNPTGELDGVGRMAVGLTIGGDEPDWVRSSTGTKLLGGGCTWRGSSCATRAGPGIAVCARWLGGGGGRRGRGDVPSATVHGPAAASM
eukprot:scaffold22153_cov118-Isochrysis_galbana.AAC.1